MNQVRLFHNPRCSKSREALALLEARGVAVEIVDYQQSPPTRAELIALLAALNVGPRALLRTGEPEYAELGLSHASLDDDALVDALLQHPRLMERPVFLRGERAVIGRPPERVLDLL